MQHELKQHQLLDGLSAYQHSWIATGSSPWLAPGWDVDLGHYILCMKSEEPVAVSRGTLGIDVDR